MYRLVIIDDEPKIAEGMKNLFPWNNVGFEVAEVFTRAQDALLFVGKEPVQVVLSDVQMPDMDGLALCRVLEPKGIKVVLFSSHQNYEYFRNALRFHAVDYLLKPVDYSALMECFEGLRTRLDDESCAAEPEVPAGYWEQIVAAVQEYMKEHCANATLEGAAERVHLSPSYLSRKFKAANGEGFVEALMRVRMEKACLMLEDIQYKGYDIAYFLGYDNPKNFGRAFKAFYGVTPSEYRKAKLGGISDE